MEVVSPKLTTRMPVTDTISEFWEAMSVHFDVQRDASCGGHVHVTPLRNGSKFTLAELKQVAFATVVYDDHVTSVLPPARRTNGYCPSNTRAGTPALQSRLRALVAGGKNTASLRQVASELRSCGSPREVWAFMQKSRYVLWNFQNVCPGNSGTCTGTVEFRGGSQFLTTKGTLAWVAFVLGFVTLATEEVSLNWL